MLLMVVKYGTPVLRRKGARVEAVTPEIRQLVADMLETMAAYKGIGLAAQQVGLPLQVAVVDVRGATDRPSSLEINGQPADVARFMPVALINPVITPVGKPAVGPEGCLSFPEIFADINRPEVVDVSALDAEGRPFRFRCGGLLARAIQHEVDHLHGILFIDRMSKDTKEEHRTELADLQAKTKAGL